MSIDLMTEVWALDERGGRRDVLFALADHADDDGFCWPSIRRIAWKAGLDRRHVQRILRQLERDGLVETIHNEAGGRGLSRSYRLHLEKGVKKPPFEVAAGKWEETPPLTRENTSVEATQTEGGDIMPPIAERATSTRERAARARVKGDIAVSPESSKNHQGTTTPPEDAARPTEIRDIDTETANVEDLAGQNTYRVLQSVLRSGKRYPARFKGHLAREVKSLFVEGFPFQVVLEAARRCETKGLNPGAIHAVVVEVQNGGRSNGHQPFDHTQHEYSGSIR